MFGAIQCRRSHITSVFRFFFNMGVQESRVVLLNQHLSAMGQSSAHSTASANPSNAAPPAPLVNPVPHPPVMAAPVPQQPNPLIMQVSLALIIFSCDLLCRLLKRCYAHRLSFRKKKLIPLFPAKCRRSSTTWRDRQRRATGSTGQPFTPKSSAEVCCVL